MAITADVVVVGAGIVGSSAAYQLARTGRDVLVLDKGPGAGFGSSSASSAIIRFGYSVLNSVVLAWESAALWGVLGDYLDAAGDEPLARFHRNGMAVIDVPAFPRARQTGFYDTVGIEYEVWEAADLVAHLPGIDPGRFYPPKAIDDEAFFDGPDGVLGAIWTPQAGFVDDPRLACENFARAAIRLGARLRPRSQVVSITQRSDDTWTLQLADGTAVSTPVVVNAAGPWSRAVNRLAGVGGEFTVRTRPLRQEVHAVPPPPGFNPAGGIGPSVADQDLGYYLRPEVGGRGLIIGGTEPACDRLEWIEDVDLVATSPTGEAFERQVVRAARRFPSLGIPSRPSGVVGVYDVADDWTPIVDRTDAIGFFVAIGTSGNQFKNGPVLGELVALLVDEVGAGHDHDRDPLQYRGRASGLSVDLGAFSRTRTPAASSGTVAG